MSSSNKRVKYLKSSNDLNGDSLDDILKIENNHNENRTIVEEKQQEVKDDGWENELDELSKHLESLLKANWKE